MKSIIGLLLLMVPLCAGVIVAWHYSPMYKGVVEQQRLEARQLLISQPDNPQRERLMKKYGFTEEEINPGWIFKNLAERK